jgi:tetratricopeptide (TPR) repeat protein
LLASFWLPVRKRAWLLVLPLLLGSQAPAQAGMQGDVNAGNRDYRKGQYDQALQKYQDAQIAAPESPVVQYDAGNALHRLEKWDDAEKAYQQAVRAKDPDLQLRSWYNLGNTFMQARKYPEAVAAYGRALRVRPKDPDTLQNLALALRYLKQPPPKDQKKNQNQNQKPKQDRSNQNQGQQNQQNKSQSQRGQKPQGPDDKGEQQAKSDAKQDTPDQAKAPKPGEMSREDAQNLLDSVREAEQEAQRKRTSGIMDRGKGKRQVPEDW